MKENHFAIHLWEEKAACFFIPLFLPACVKSIKKLEWVKNGVLLKYEAKYNSYES